MNNKIQRAVHFVMAGTVLTLASSSAFAASSVLPTNLGALTGSSLNATLQTNTTSFTGNAVFNYSAEHSGK